MATIVEMGFSAEQAVAALKGNNNNLPQAVGSLIAESDATDRDRRAPRGRQHNDRPGRFACHALYANTWFIRSNAPLYVQFL